MKSLFGSIGSRALVVLLEALTPIAEGTTVESLLGTKHIENLRG